MASGKSDNGWGLLVEVGLSTLLAQVYGPERNSRISTGGGRNRTFLSRNLEPSHQVVRALSSRLQSDYLNVMHEDNSDILLLKKFANSWKKFTTVVSWLRKTSPDFSRQPMERKKGKTLEICVLELFNEFILERVEEKVQEAVFRIIQAQKNSDIGVDAVLMSSVSRVFYESLQRKNERFLKKWLEPILKKYSQLYLQDTTALVHDGVVQGRDNAITEACLRAIVFCPTAKTAAKVGNMLQGFARVQTYMELNLTLTNPSSGLGARMVHGDIEDLKIFYSGCRNLQHLDYIPIMFRSHHSALLAKNLHNSTVYNDVWFGVTNRSRRLANIENQPQFSGADNMIRRSVDLITLYKFKFAAERSAWEKWYDAMKTKEIRDMLEDIVVEKFRMMLNEPDSEVALILNSNNEGEIGRLYNMCLHTVHLPKILTELRTFEFKREIETAREVIDEAKEDGSWLESGFLLNLHVKFDHILRRVHLRVPYSYHECQHCESLHSDVGEQNSSDMAPGIGLHRRAKRDGCRGFWGVILSDYLPKVFSELIETEESDISKALKTKDYDTLTSMYAVVLLQAKLKDVVAPILVRAELETYTEHLWNLVRSGISTMFARNSVNEINREVENVIGHFLKRYPKLVEKGWSAKHKDTVDALYKKEVNGLRRRIHTFVRTTVENALEDPESQISMAFKRKEKLDLLRRAFQKLDLRYSCNSKQTLSQVILRYEVRETAKPIWELVENCWKVRWFKQGKVRLLDHNYTKTQNLIKRHCSKSNYIDRKNELNNFDRASNMSYVLSQMNKQLKSIFLLSNRNKINRIYRICQKLGALQPHVCRMFVKYEVEAHGRNIWNRFILAQTKLKSTDLSAKSQIVVAELASNFSTEGSARYRIMNDVMQGFMNLYAWSKQQKVSFQITNGGQQLINDSFIILVNQNVDGRPSPFPQILSQYIDKLMRTSSQVQFSERFHDHLRDVVQILSYVARKDKCRLLLEKQLAQRLFSRADQSRHTPKLSEVEHEHVLLRFIQEECGQEMITNMMSMMDDFQEGLSIAESFFEYVKARQQKGDRAAGGNIITVAGDEFKGTREEVVDLPSPLADVVSRFEDYYSQTNPQKLLKYAHSLGKVSFKACLSACRGQKKRSVEMTGNVFQASVVLQFNTERSMTYAAIQESLYPSRSDDGGSEALKLKARIYAAVRSMLCGEFPLLRKEPDSEDRIKPTDVLRLNSRFKPPQTGLQLPLPDADFFEEGLKELQGSVRPEESRAVDRQWMKKFVQAVVMREMKKRGEEELQTLFEDVAKSGREVEPVLDITQKIFKKVVEDLIERDLLERNGEDHALLQYVRL